MIAVKVEPGADPLVLDVPIKVITDQLCDQIHEEELPIEGTMSLSALKTEGLMPNEAMAQLTDDAGYFGAVYICAVWYKSLSREQIYAILDWLEDGTLPLYDSGESHACLWPHCRHEEAGSW